MTGRLPLVLFDGDCAFCTSSINRLTATFPDAFDARPFQHVDLAALGLSTARCRSELQWVPEPDRAALSGNLCGGAQAVAALLRVGGRSRGGLLGASAVALGTVSAYPPLSWVAAGVYAAVAAHRSRLPGGTPACEM